MKKITKKTKLPEVLEINPEAGMILMEAGMHCLGCAMSMYETLEQGCLAHGMTPKEIDKLVEELNKK